VTQVLVAGSGVAAVECVLALRALAGPRVAIELLSPVAEFVHRPSAVRTPFSGAPRPRVQLDRLAAELGLRLRRDALASVVSDQHYVQTRDGADVPYELLVVATGARSHGAVPGAATFQGPTSAGLVEHAITRVAASPERRLAFTAPSGAHWLLPLYELALLAAGTLRERGVSDPDIVVATSEHEPLQVLGPAAGEAVRGALDAAGIDLVTSATAVSALEGALRLEDGRLVAADYVVALPKLVGPSIGGLPQDDDGYIPVDEHGRVHGASDVYAAGDVTDVPVKHGSIAAQQADAVAQAIAARVGAIGFPEPFRPVLRGLLLTGSAPLYLRAELGAGGRQEHRVLPVEGTVSSQALWWPPGKVAGRYLTPFLATGDVSAAPLEDRGPSEADDFALALLVAEQDAASGDHAAAVQALDEIEARLGRLPAGSAERRDEWRGRLAMG
jgi:sulfide:quinone oxidoreductase